MNIPKYETEDITEIITTPAGDIVAAKGHAWLSTEAADEGVIKTNETGKALVDAWLGEAAPEEISEEFQAWYAAYTA